MNTDWISTWWPTVLNTGLRLLAILVIAFLVRRALRLLTQRMVKLASTTSRVAQMREEQTRTLAGVLYSAGSAIIVFIAVVMALTLIDVDIRPVAAVAGLASLAVGFGAQNLVRDLISGFFIVFEDQFVVGETVRIGGTTGRVEDLTLRRTLVRDAAGALCVIPNGEIRAVANLSREWSQIFVDVPLPAEANLDRAMRILEDVCTEFRADPAWAEVLVDGPRVLGVESLRPIGATIRVQIRTAPTRQHDTARELRRRIQSQLGQQ